MHFIVQQRRVTVVTVAIMAYARSRRSSEKASLADVDDDVRENIRRYEDEGGGEDDIRAFDLRSLRIAVDATGKPFGKTLDASSLFPSKSISSHVEVPTVQVDINAFLEDRSHKLHCAPQELEACDECKKYAYEGRGSGAGSLSSLNSGRENIEKDFDYLNTGRVHFSKSTDVYQVHNVSSHSRSSLPLQ